MLEKIVKEQTSKNISNILDDVTFDSERKNAKLYVPLIFLLVIILIQNIVLESNEEKQERP
ncbi:MAG: hypothetical protein ACJ706_04220 [Nitrososphaeraceae archaeon]